MPIEEGLNNLQEGEFLPQEGGKVYLSPSRFFNDMFFRRLIYILELEGNEEEIKIVKRYFLGDVETKNFNEIIERMANLPEKLKKLVEIFLTSRRIKEQIHSEAALLPFPSPLVDVGNITHDTINQLLKMVRDLSEPF